MWPGPTKGPLFSQKYSKSAFFIWYENGRQHLLGAQSINTERASLTTEIPFKRVHLQTQTSKETSPKLNFSNLKRCFLDGPFV